ncbi:MAG: IS200/IS605 family transposase [Fimbriimonadales bacterium]
MAKRPVDSSRQRTARAPFEQRRTTGSSAYRLYAVIAFHARAKQPLFDAEVAALFSKALPDICASYDYQLVAYRVVPNQVYLILGFKPTDALASVVSNIKRATAHCLFEGIPRLEAEIGKRNFWAEGYLAETISHAEIDTIIHMWKNRARKEETVLIQTFEDLKPLHPKQIERMLDDLLPAERVVLRLLHGLQGEPVHTLEQAAEKLSMKPHEVHQIAQESLAKIRALLRERRAERAAGRSA